MLETLGGPKHISCNVGQQKEFKKFNSWESSVDVIWLISRSVAVDEPIGNGLIQEEFVYGSGRF